MVRRKKKIDARRLSDAELLELFDGSLDTLQHLARVYDEGHSPIAFLMATEITKLLTENSAAIKLRGTRLFPTIPDAHDERVLNAIYKLTGARLGGDPPTVTFMPKFQLPEPDPVVELPFKDWWNRDIIYRASAAPPGTPAGLIPVNDSPTIPYHKREKVTRMKLVSLLRNKLGSHQDAEMPRLLDELDESKNWGSFGIDTPEGTLSTDDGTLKIAVRLMPAMMRQICHEVLVAYQRHDPPPAHEEPEA